MVFVIQHTQARHQRATQCKLDEILRAMPGTDNSLLTLEHASDEELRAAGHQHREIRQAALDDHSGSAQSAPKKIRLSALRNTGSNQPAIARRRLVPQTRTGLP